MLSKIRCVAPFLQNNLKRSFSKKPVSPSTADKAKAGIKEEFLDSSKFKDNMLMLYQSRETTSCRVISGILLSLGLYDAYKYYEDDTSSSNTEGMMAFFIFGFLALFEMKLHRTPKSIFLDANGYSVFVDFYRFFGWGSKIVELHTRDFRGYGPYFKKYSKVPIVRYEYGIKNRFFFFKPGYILEDHTLRRAFHGYTFKVGNEGTNINLSKKAKSKYDI
jgi:hypothetical protein